MAAKTAVAAPSKVTSCTPSKVEREEDTRAQEYYDSEDAFNFYQEVWGGENIHVGLYDKIGDSADDVKEASQKSLQKLFSLRRPQKGAMLMDMGSAYGGSARYAVREFGVMVSCVDLSAKENAKNLEMTAEAGLSDQIWIHGERTFTATGEPDASFDLVTSQDSFLHAGQYRAAAIAEAARVLKPGGSLVFSDIMQSDTCDLKQMAPVFARINLDDMGSPAKYQRWALEAGLEFQEFVDVSYTLEHHYSTVRRVLLAYQERGDIRGKVSDEFVERMAAGLQSWVEQAQAGNLAYGYMVFSKPAEKAA